MIEPHYRTGISWAGPSTFGDLPDVIVYFAGEYRFIGLVFAAGAIAIAETL